MIANSFLCCKVESASLLIVDVLCGWGMCTVGLSIDTSAVLGGQMSIGGLGGFGVIGRGPPAEAGLRAMNWRLCFGLGGGGRGPLDQSGLRTTHFCSS